MDEPVKVLKTQELPEALKAFFSDMFELETEIAALKSVHIDPKADERTTMWREIKAATGIARKDLDLYYRLYKRDRDAGQMDDEDAGQQIKADLRRLYAALAAGETLDWIGAVVGEAEPEAETSEPEDDAVPFAAPEPQDEIGADDGDREPEQEAAAAPEIEAETGPDADWGAQEADASDAAFDNAGQVFNEGEAAGIDGRTPQDNPYQDGIRAATWERGRKAGIRKALEGVGGNVVPMTAAAE